MKLCALCKGDPKELIFGLASVQAIRVGTLRDSDIAEITLEDEANSKFSVTTSHNVLANVGGDEWMSPVASSLRPGVHKLFVMRRDEAIAPIGDGCLTVQSMRKVVQTCEVVELELEDKADAILLQLSEGVFTAVFGSAGWEPMWVMNKNGSVDVVDANRDVANCSTSDTSHNRRSLPSPVYRTIRRPHDAHCTAWCRYHFAEQGCRKGFLCNMCHSPDHREQAHEQAEHKKTHHGKRR